jgi:hypothetical protein
MQCLGHSTAQIPQPLQWSRSTPVSFSRYTCNALSGHNTQQIMQWLQFAKSMSGRLVRHPPVRTRAELPGSVTTPPCAIRFHSGCRVPLSGSRWIFMTLPP